MDYGRKFVKATTHWTRKLKLSLQEKDGGTGEHKSDQTGFPGVTDGDGSLPLAQAYMTGRKETKQRCQTARSDAVGNETIDRLGFESEIKRIERRG
jgi:hypothetical protein